VILVEAAQGGLMSTTAPSRQRSPRSRRAGYVVALLVNGALLYVANEWPGWGVVPVLTEDTRSVMPAVNASLVVGMAVNALFITRESAWLRALGDLATTM
jgi:hypothetical protein